MKHEILSWIAELKTLSINSPFQEVKKFNPETQTTTVQTVSYYEYCIEQEFRKAETLSKMWTDAQKYEDIDMPAKVSEFQRKEWNLDGHYGVSTSPEARARQRAGEMVRARREALKPAITSSTQSFFRSQEAQGKVKPEILKAIEDIPYTLHSIAWCEAVLFLLGVTSLKKTGTYTGLVEHKEPIGIHKTTEELEPTEEEEDAAL